MKKIISVAAAVLCVGFLFCGCQTKNSAVSEKEVKNRVIYNKVTNAAQKDFFNYAFAEGSEEKPTILSENEKDAKKDIETDLKICSDCKDKKILISKSAAKKAAKKEFKNLKSDSSQKEYYDFLSKAIKENGLSESEFIDITYENAYYFYNRAALKSYFQSNLYDSDSNLSLDEQFVNYTDNLK